MRELCKTLLFYLVPVLFLAACGGGADAPPGKKETKREEAVSFIENSTAVVQQFVVASSSLDIPISGGADQDLFEIVDIDPATGLKGLAFVQPPDFEKPLDADKDNIYKVDYTISTSAQNIVQSFTVTVADENDVAPVVHTRSWTVEENDASASAFLMIDATDVDTVGTLQYGIENKDEYDNLKFVVDLDTGKLTFRSPPDFEAQSVYTVSVGAIDGVNVSEFVLVTVTVTDVNDPPSTPVLSLSYGDSQLILDWTDSIGATKYNVMYDDGNGYTLLEGISSGGGAPESMYDISHLLDWVSAKFKIEAVNEKNKDAYSTSNEVQKTLGYFKASNTGAGDQFGQAVAISDDGMVMAVGAWQEDSASTGVGGDETEDCISATKVNCAENSGAVYIFRKDSNGTWAQEAYIKASNTGAGDEFGRSVALSNDGSTLVVGARNEDSAANTINGDEVDDCGAGKSNCASNSGAAYVFVKTGSGWLQEAYIKASNVGADDEFGYSLSLSDDGNTLAVGAWREDSDSIVITPGTSLGTEDNDNAPQAGASYVFVRETEAGSWTQQAYIKAENSESNDNFGYAVSLSGDGNRLAVSAILEDSPSKIIDVPGSDTDVNFDAGAVYVYSRVDTSWSPQAYIKPTNTGQDDRFGEAVSMSLDGNALAVSSRFEDSKTDLEDDCSTAQLNCVTDSGAVYVFTYNGADWSQNGYLKASNPGEDDQFGFSLALSGDGNSILVGANNEDSDNRSVGTTQTENNAMSNSGAAYLFKYQESTWEETKYIKAANTDTNDAFGSAVSISSDGGILAIGALGEGSDNLGVAPGGFIDNNNKTASGAVYLY